MKYAVINELNKVSNVVIWNGITQYNPSEGTLLVLVEESVFCDIGYEFNQTNNTFALI